MRTPAAIRWTTGAALLASIAVHAAAIPALVASLAGDPSRPDPPDLRIDLRDVDSSLHLRDGLDALGDLDRVTWGELSGEASIHTALWHDSDCGLAYPRGGEIVGACSYGPYPVEAVGVPWTIGIGGSHWPASSWAHTTGDDAWLVTLLPGRTPCNARVTAGRAPPYPADALAVGVRGSVGIAAEVAADGRATRVSIERSSGHASLDDAAAAAAREWTWRVDGEGPWTGRMTVRFRAARRPPPVTPR